jgi:hypothetical protein
MYSTEFAAANIQSQLHLFRPLQSVGCPVQSLQLPIFEANYTFSGLYIVFVMDLTVMRMFFLNGVLLPKQPESKE